MAVKIFVAYILDLFAGDPHFIPHPVRLMGRCITLLERFLYKPYLNKKRQIYAGIVLAVLLPGGTYVLVWLLLYIADKIYGWLNWFLSVYFLYTAICTRELANAGMKVFYELNKGDLVRAREALSEIVGRDTYDLPAAEVARGAIETVAENVCDGIVAPIFYAAIGGVPLALAYKAINTLDSMVGYKNERYLYFGWASAKLDDLANFIPARLSAVFLLLAAWFLRYDAWYALKIVRKFARAHPSPNSGFPEAAVAGTLKIRLGGNNFYGGKISFRPYIGEMNRPIVVEDIKKAVSLMHFASLLSVAVAIIIFIWRSDIL